MVKIPCAVCKRVLEFEEEILMGDLAFCGVCYDDMMKDFPEGGEDNVEVDFGI